MGKIIKQTGTVKQPLRFASYYWDQDAGLYHLGARWYDPTLMRFISVDPNPGDKDDSFSLNEYLYCQNNPLVYVDPDGDKRIKVIFRSMIKKVRSPADKFTDKLVAMGVGDAAVYMSKNSKFWRYAINHPYIVGAGVGIGGGTCFVFASAGISGASVAIGNYIASQQWSRGTFGSVTESLKYHLSKHGGDLGVRSYYQMTKVAKSLRNGRWSFSVNYGRLRFEVTDGRYKAYFDEFGKILTVFKIK